MRLRSASLGAALALGVVFSGAVCAQPPPAAPPALLPTAGKPLTLPAGGRQQVRVVLVADGLVAPWDIVFIPGTSDLLVTESSGKLRMIQGGKLLPDALWTSPSPAGRDLLHGVVVHPDFARNKLVYMSYQGRREESDSGKPDGTVIRLEPAPAAAQ